MQTSSLKILIVRRPIGEAPEWVRDAWIGLEIPVGHPREKSWSAFGVLSGPRGVLSAIGNAFRGRAHPVDGYAVNARLAVELLAQHQPEAAEWWRENAPHSLSRWQSLVFDTRACEVRC